MTNARVRITCRPRSTIDPITGADIDLRVVLADGTEARLPAYSLQINADASGKPIEVLIGLNDVEFDLDLPVEVLRRLAPQEPSEVAQSSPN